MQAESSQEIVKKSSNVKINPMSPIDLSSKSSQSDAWTSWYMQFRIFVKASGLQDEPNDKQVAILLHHLGPDVFPIFKSFNVDMDTVLLSDLIQLFNNYFLPKKNIAVERNNFFTRKQSPGETIDEFLTDLKILSQTCEFGVIEEELVRDLFRCGLNEDNIYIKERLLQEGNITLQQTVNIAKNLELSKQHTLQLSQKSVLSVNDKHESVKCRNCGMVHRSKCPASGVKCHKCQKLNHFARCCRSKPNNVKHIKQSESESESDSHEFTVGTVASQKQVTWDIDIFINNKKVCCQLDSGAQANVMSRGTYQYLQLSHKLKPTKAQLSGYGGSKIPVIGRCRLDCQVNNTTHQVNFYVTNDNLRQKTILGLHTCQTLNLIQKICAVNSTSPQGSKFCESLLSEYSDVFEGLGCLPGTTKIHLKPNSVPKVDAPRKIPFKLSEKFKAELNKMVDMGVIEKVKEVSEWVNSVVLVEKSNKSLRVCLDPRSLNKFVMRPQYQFPTIESVSSQLVGANIFSILDASSGFWTMKLDKASSKLTTFNTPFGRYRYLRFPFGISSGPEEFHQKIVALFEGIPNLITYMDDFLIFASDKQQHDFILRKVLDRAREVNLKFNKSKCKFGQSEVSFIGHKISSKGLKVDPSKVDAIVKMESPKSVPELQRFLGMVNYLGSYVKNLSLETANLRSLLRKNVAWIWDENHENEFLNLKKQLSCAPILTYYDPSKPITLSADASKNAVGVVIMHDCRPIAYASKSLTSSQQNFAQIEKELYAILYGCIRFHQFVYGQKIFVETDHQPLVTLFKKPLGEVPTRLQRMMIQLQAYDLIVQYKSGKKMFVADTLSRAPVRLSPDDSVMSDCDLDITVHVNQFLQNLAVTEEKLNKLREETVKDETLQQVQNFILTEWPLDCKNLNNEMKTYFKCRSDLHELDGLVFKNESVVIPVAMRNDIINCLHESHRGVERTINLAKDKVYWPNISDDIYKVVTNCHVCQKYKNSNPRQPLLPHEPVDIPWSKVGIDLFHYKKALYLMIVDYYSKYFEISLLSSSKSQQVITYLKSNFARHGIPMRIISDNGPPFNSLEFSKFCKEWDIEHCTSSPYYPRSNGLVEKTIGTVKKLFYKCEEDGTDPYIALLNYRTTPRGQLSSPSMLLMSRHLRTKIPEKLNNLKPKLVDVEREKEKKMKENYDRGTRELKSLDPKNKILFQKTPRSEWIPGEIVSSCEEPRSYVVRSSLDGEEYRRNRQHIQQQDQQFSRYGRRIVKPRRYLD